MYHFQSDKLRVSRELSIKNKPLLSNSRLIFVQHIVENTHEYIRHLKEAGGADIFCIFSKPYSIDPIVSKDIKSEFRLENHSYDELENSNIILDVLKQAQSQSDKDGKKIILLDVGGYFCNPVLKLKDLRHITGVVEDTTFGHNRYLKEIKTFPLPIFSVARSPLKEIEARFVGRDAVMAMDSLLRQIGVLISGRRALVLGYGMIGKNVARSLKSHDLRVSCYDILDSKNLHALIDGYNIGKKRDLIQESDIIFSATASTSLTYDDIKDCKNNVILASVGSKTIEFDMSSIIENSTTQTSLKGSELIEYQLPHSKSVVVAKAGAAVNFLLKSTPTEVLDLVFSEIIICTKYLLERKRKKNYIHKVGDEELSAIAKNWLIDINS